MTVTINGVKYTLKTAFSDYTIEEYLEVIKHSNLPVIDRLSKYTGIPTEVLNGLPLNNITMISEVMNYIENEELLNSLAEPFEGIDVGLRSYGDFERAKGLIQASDLITSLPSICELYTGLEIKGKPLLEVWAVAVYYLNSINKFFDKFKRLGLHEYTDEELEAGVEVLEGYKHYPVVFKLGAERGMTNDEVLALPAIEVYMQMLYEFDRSEYEKRLNEVIRNRQEHFSKLQK